MVDHNQVLRDYLGSVSALTSLLGSFGVVAGQLPEKFDPDATPASSPCVVVNREGAGTPFETSAIVTARMKVRTWCGMNQYQKAAQVDAQIFEALALVNGVTVASGTIIKSIPNAVGNDITDPDTGWATVLSYYEVTARV